MYFAKPWPVDARSTVEILGAIRLLLTVRSCNCAKAYVGLVVCSTVRTEMQILLRLGHVVAVAALAPVGVLKTCKNLENKRAWLDASM